MRISTVFELLLIFLLIAFAASRVIDSNNNQVARKIAQPVKKVERQESAINKYCNCTESICNCCRDFSVPLVNINGPGCAKLQYVPDDNIAVALSFADRVIATKNLSGKKPRPVCMPIPGGFSSFCGRVYNIARQGEEFKACLGLELQSSDIVEAALRVSCFKFGPRGVTSEPSEPLPLAVELQDQTDDDDDDDDDEFDLGGVVDDDDDDDDDDEDDDDDDDDDEFGIGDDEDDDDDDDDAAEGTADTDSSDYSGFSILGEDILGGLFGSGSTGTKKPIKKKTGTAPQTAKPIAAKPVTPKPIRKTTQKRKPSKAQVVKTTTAKPVEASVLEVEVENTEAPIKNVTPLNLLHTSALLQLTNKPEDQNEISVPNSVLNKDDKVVASIPESTMEKVTLITADKNKIRPAIIVSEPESATPIQDPGIQSSISYITGQLSEVPVTTIVSNTKRPSSLNSQVLSPSIETLPSAVVNESPVKNEEEEDEDDEGGVQIVDSFGDDDEKPGENQISIETEENDDDSESESNDDSEDTSTESIEGEKETVENDEEDDDDDDDDDDEDDDSDSTTEKTEVTESNKNKKKKTKDEDDDILGLSALSETFGFGGSEKKKNKTKVDKVQDGGVKKKDDDDILGLSSITDSLGLRRFGARIRGRQNKMMRFDRIQ